MMRVIKSNPYPISPLERYQMDVTSNGFSFDEEQHRAIQQLDILYGNLIKKQDSPINMFKRLFRIHSQPLTGIYLWGGVGRGKTYLMDLFFGLLPLKNKKRMHFHRFMYWVHQQLKEFDGAIDPLKLVAAKLSSETQILCFDEFFVSDITDAMILGVLLEEMFDQGICIVATSNVEPNRLYLNGLQRSRFLPAIDLLNRNTQLLNVDSGIDYRLRTLEQAEIYHSPLDSDAEKNLQFSYTHLTTKVDIIASEITINDRVIPVRACAEGVVWLDYNTACTSPRSVNDYIELSKLFHSILLSGVPELDDSINDQVRRFISLVDEFYDRNVKLIIAAAVPLSSLYKGVLLDFEFKRTLSRLQEMQSLQYLGKEHIP